MNIQKRKEMAFVLTRTITTNATMTEEIAVFQILTPTPTGMRIALIANVLRGFVNQLAVSYIKFFFLLRDV